ncbi:MAG: hypothetical protein CVU44_13845 [Chloroflexi bacterium HGW-Chloroflexi-6]|nr:MAG: hypothetical protein CVU44_13845 [Chloroflexi bacterium HGW-Chloroflexi-6]
MSRNQVSLLVALAVLTLACVLLPVTVTEGPDEPTALPPTPTGSASTATAAVLPTEAAASPTLTLPLAEVLAPEERLDTVTDETNAIRANIPTVWTDTRTDPWLDAKGNTLGIIFLASTDIEAFLAFKAEGVAISVSRRLPVGYTQLLDEEYEFYVTRCQDTYKTRWKLDGSVYRGMYFVFGECDQTRDAWLSLFSVVSQQDSSQYIARVVGYDMIPTYGDTFRDIIMDFEVFPENLP